MAHADTTETDAPASSDERVEAFAEFLDGLEEDEDSAAGALPTEEEAPDSSGADARDEADEPEDTAIVPPVSWGQDAKALFEILQV